MCIRSCVCEFARVRVWVRVRACECTYVLENVRVFEIVGIFFVHMRMCVCAFVRAYNCLCLLPYVGWRQLFVLVCACGRECVRVCVRVFVRSCLRACVRV